MTLNMTITIVDSMIEDNTEESVYIKIDTRTNKKINKVILTKYEAESMNRAFGLNYVPFKFSNAGPKIPIHNSRQPTSNHETT